MNELVLSIFPGIDLLGRAFEEEGFCVVRGPDVLWGGDIRYFHPPVRIFDGVIGGPPCQEFSVLKKANPHCGIHGNLIPEFERVVVESQATWWIMENVKDAPFPNVAGYQVRSLILNNRWLGEPQNRVRRFSFGTTEGLDLLRFLDVAIFESLVYETAVLAGHDDYISRRGWDAPARPLERLCELQGLPGGFFKESPFKKHEQKKVLGNAVPMPMGRAIAKAVRKIYNENGFFNSQQE